MLGIRSVGRLGTRVGRFGWHDEFEGDRIDATKWRATGRAYVADGAVRRLAGCRRSGWPKRAETPGAATGLIRPTSTSKSRSIMSGVLYQTMTLAWRSDGAF